MRSIFGSSRLGFVFLIAGALSLAAADNTTVQILKKHVITSRNFTIEVAKQMPADQYGFKLTPEQMSFGEQMVHIANANGFFFGKMTGQKGPASDPKKVTKESAIAALEASYSFAANALDNVNDSKLLEIVDTGDGKMTMLEGVMLLLDHSTNHRASAEMYLRVKGIKPAEYRF
ncbi:MAG: DinB family protein [Acidobacteriota bacterium]|nr:DinB family protein [Acidobacteriota bacterium]